MFVTALFEGKLGSDGVVNDKKYGGALGIGKPLNLANIWKTSPFGSISPQGRQQVDGETQHEHGKDDWHSGDLRDADMESLVPPTRPASPFIVPFHLQRSASLPTSLPDESKSHGASVTTRHKPRLSDMITISRLLKRVDDAESAQHAAETDRDALICAQKELSRDLRTREERDRNAALLKDALVTEISSLSNQLNGLCDDKRILLDKTADLVTQVQRLQAGSDAMSKERVDTERRMREEGQTLQSSLTALEIERDDLLQANINLSAQLSSAIAFKVDFEAQLTTLHAIHTEYANTTRQLKTERDDAISQTDLGEETKRTLRIRVAELEGVLGNLEKENGVLKMRLAEFGIEKDTVTNQVIELNVQLRVNESQIREMLAKSNIAAARETSLEARVAELEQAMSDVSNRLAIAQREAARGAEEVTRLTYELELANDRESGLLTEVTELNEQTDILRRDLKLTESRCKILGMELDRPLWETAKQQRERVEKEEEEEALREATRKYMEKMAKAERARAAEEARIQREVEQRQREEAEEQRKAEEERRRAEALKAEAARKKLETERKQREEEEKRRQAEEERALAEKRRAEAERAAAAERLRQAEAERMKRERERQRRVREAEILRQDRWRRATEDERARCSSRDLGIWPGPNTRVQWRRHTALSRFQTVLDEFSKIRFSEAQPLTVMSVPWPSLANPSEVEMAITQGEYDWRDVERFFLYAKAHMALVDLRQLVKTARKCFHPDQWAGRSLLASVQDEELRITLKDLCTTVSQAVNDIAT